ncbi:aKG-HExxH-type peptide beta-hydroxylase [Kribbella catacumbae]|uniref:aKG-HExxH-type peptide beta-hydroxylase n=1 Tax=Kribbella catacumbae TaxID=460086 RepID=UPI0003801E7F|nr:HEXXH motif-containing putative peptide modification protein [Kribbella catacumbae]
MQAEQFFAEIGGVPFIDDATVQPKTILSAVAMVRRNTEPEAFAKPVDYLDPENACQIFERHARSTPDDIQWSPMPAAEQELVGQAESDILGWKPEWAPLLRIPKRYRRMATSTGSTSVLVPQTIYLGPGAFRDAETLRETLVHEHAHIWLNFVAEAFDLQAAEAPRDYTLPSGTSGKTYRGVLSAAHFAAAASRALAVRLEFAQPGRRHARVTRLLNK